MKLTRRSVLLALIVVAACSRDKNATHGDVVERDPIPLPAKLEAPEDTQAILKAVRDARFLNREFAAGHMQAWGKIKDEVNGQIQPHVNSAKGDSLVSGKILARVIVDDSVPERGYRFGTNYWFAAKFDGKPGWRGLMVNLNTGKVFEYGMNPFKEKHADPSAKWIPVRRALASANRAWTTCDGNECCCDAPNCDDPEPLDTLKNRRPASPVLQTKTPGI